VASRRSSAVWAALADRADSEGMAAYVARYLEWLRVHNYAEPTVLNRELYLGYFILWTAERGLRQPREITKPILERYQRSLYHLRKSNGEPISLLTGVQF
jgi:integrase/recombinase XerD